MTRRNNKRVNANVDGASWADSSEPKPEPKPQQQPNPEPKPEPKPQPTVKVNAWTVQKEESGKKDGKEKFINGFVEHFDRNQMVFNGIALSLEAILNNLKTTSSFFDGTEYSLYELKNDESLKLKLKECEIISDNAKQQTEKIEKIIPIIFEALVETMNALQKLYNSANMCIEFKNKIEKAEKEAQMLSLKAASEKEKKESPMNEFMLFSAPTIKIDQDVLDKSKIKLEDIEKTIKVKLPFCDKQWIPFTKLDVVMKLDTEIKTIIEEVKEIKKNGLSSPQPVQVSSSETVQVKPAAKPVVKTVVTSIPQSPRMELEHRLEPLTINFNPTKNCTLDSRYIDTVYTIKVPGYRFPNLEFAKRFINHEKPVGKFMFCHDTPEKIGFIVESNNMENLPRTFQMKNYLGSFMGCDRTKWCPFAINCYDQNCLDYHDHKKDDAFSYSPSYSKCPCLRHGDSRIFIDGDRFVNEKMSQKHLDPELLNRSPPIKPMYCPPTKFTITTSHDMNTYLSMRMCQAIALFLSNPENIDVAEFCVMRGEETD
jgi:hypothetical protein